MQPYQPGNPYGPNAPNVHGGPYAQAPYAAPAMYRENVFVPPGASAGPLVGPALRNVKLATGIGQILSLVAALAFFVAAAVMEDETGSILAAVGLAGFALWYLLFAAYGIVSLVWLYKFWSWLPPDQRYSSMWKKYISPGAAIGFMLVPYFNLYWMFVVYLGIADAMERLRVQYPSTKGPVKTLAILTLVIPIVFFPAGPFLHFIFAKHVEEMAKEMHARMVPPHLAPIGYGRDRLR